MIRLYIVRHGVTAISPRPEGWMQIGLSREGWGQARAAAEFLQQYIKDGHERPRWAVSSDLLRAEETLSIIGPSVGVQKTSITKALRAYDASRENPRTYEIRTDDIFKRILDAARKANTTVLVVCHRSSTGFLGKFHNILDKDPDYRYDALLLECGIMAVADEDGECKLKPLFRFIESNWPKEVVECQI